MRIQPGDGKSDAGRITRAIGEIASAAPGLGQPVPSAGSQSHMSGGLVVNGIAPAPPPPPAGNDDEADSPSYFLDTTRNRLRPYSPVPVVFGRHRVVPPLGAEVVTEIVGSMNHLRLIVIWGYGPLEISDLRIGSTPISEFEARVETREGRPGEKAITIYPDDIHQENFTSSLTHAASWITHRSAEDADELSVDVSLPRGLASFNARGNRVEHSVILEIQYRKVGGAASWLSATNTQTSMTFAPLWITNNGDGQVRLRGARTHPIRHGIRWTVPDRGQYDVRVRRVSADETSDRTYSTLVWTTLRTITDREPISFPKDLALSAIDIRATDQLAGVLDEINGIVQSSALDYSEGSDSWVSRTTRNPASLFRLALQSPARREPALDDEIDLDALADFHRFCERNSYRFSYIQDSKRSLWDLLVAICAVARASPVRVNNRWSVVVDDGVQPVRQHFTPLNAGGFSLQRSFAPPPHGLRVHFPNEDGDEYKRDERIVYADGYDDTSATLVPTVSPIGITNSNHAWKHARFQLAQTLLRREVWTLETGLEFLVARRGDRVTCQHDVLAVGLASARVAEVIEDLDGNAAAIELDAPIRLPDAVTYGVKIRTSNNADIVRAITQTGGAASDAIEQLTFTTPLRESIEVGALLSIGEIGRVTIDGLVTARHPADDLSARLSIVPYQAGVYLAESGTIPPFDSRVSGALARLALVIVSIVSDSSIVRLIGTAYQPGIGVEVIPIGNVDAVIDVEIRPSKTGEPYRPAAVRHRARDSLEIGDVETEISYDFRLRWSVPDQQPGPWTEVLAHEVVGASAPPTPLDFLIDILGDGTRRFRWIPPEIRSLAGVELRYGEAIDAVFGAMTALHSGLLTSDHYESVEPQREGQYRFGLRSVDTDGLGSDPVYIVADIGPTRSGDVIYWRCPSAEGWPGTIANAERTQDGLDALVGFPSYDWTEPPTWDAWTSYAGGTGDDYATAMSYIAPVVDLGFITDVSVGWQADTEGTVTVEYRVSLDETAPAGAWTEVVAAETIRGRQFEIRWSLAGDGTILLFLDHLCFSFNAPSAIENFRDVNTNTWGGSLANGREIPSVLELVTDIDLTLQNVGPGWTWEILSKNPPTVKLYNGNSVSSDAVVDATVRGLRSR